MAVSIALICVLGYLLGGINGAILLSKLVEKDDAVSYTHLTLPTISRV